MPGQMEQPGYNQQFQPAPQMTAYPPGQQPQQFSRPPGPGQPGPLNGPGQPPQQFPNYGQQDLMGGNPAYTQPTQQQPKRLDSDQMSSAVPGVGLGERQNNIQPGMPPRPPSGQNNGQPGMPPMPPLGPGGGQNHVQSGMPPSGPGAGQNNVQPGMPPRPPSGQNNVQSGMPPMLPTGPGGGQNHVQPGMPPMPPSGPGGGQNNIQPGMPPMPPSGPGGGHNNVQPGMHPMPQSNAPTSRYPSYPQQSPQLSHAPNGPGMPGQMRQPFTNQPLGGQQNHVQPGMPPMPHAPNGPGMPGQMQPPGHNQQLGGQQNHVQPGMPPMPPSNAPTSRYPSYPQQPPQLPHAPNGPGMPGQMQRPGYNQQFQSPMNAYPPGQQPQQFSRPPGPGQPGAMSAPGQPPYPNYGQQDPNQMGGTPAYPQPTQQQPKRLDPDQMPSAIAVMQEDQQTRSGLFVTNQKGLMPPLVTTKFQVQDQGNASPRFVRSTMYSVPALPDMLKQTAIPFALIVNPFEDHAKDETPLQCVDLGPIGPVRCLRCKAYMSPLMQFIDGGRRFQCLLCKATTEVPPEYFQHLDHTGQRLDKWERPELLNGSYEYVATVEYCRNNVLPKEPAFIFVIDVSYNNVKSGLVNLLCSHIKSLVELLPPHTPVGFVTYNSKVHFYNIDPTLAQPQMVIVPDVADMFMPLLTGFLVPRGEAASSIEALMEQIPVMFADTKETEAVLGPAIVAGTEALKASERVGKLLLFHSSLPVSDAAPGKLRNREADRKLLGTEKEKVVLTPQITYYNNLGQDCVGAGVSVDLYLFNNSYIDVATIGQVARITGGSVNKYTYFQADIDGPRVIGELHYHLSRPIGFDGVMRVRTSTGVRPVDFYGHYYMSNTTDVELAAIDPQKSIAVEIKHDDKLTEEDGVYIQIALLYTSMQGQRRLRIHNVALSTCTQMADLYRNCELDTIVNFLAKQGISKSVESTPVALKDGVISRCAQMLATYRKHCANPSMPGQLILPECLKLLPLYTNCVLRSDAVAGTSEITPDDRSWLMYMVMTMGVSNTVHYFYPKLIPIHGPNISIDNPVPVRCSRDKMSDEYAFLLENGVYIFFWIGAAVSPDWLQNIFGVSNLAQINVEAITELPDHVNSDESLRLRALIRSLRNERQRHMRLTVVRQRDKMEAVMNKFLVEDRGSDGQPSYVDFLCHMHKEIRALLNQ